MNQLSADALTRFLMTLDRLGLMEPYLITVEMKPKAYLNKWSNIEYEKPEKVYGMVIRIMNDKGVIRRITIEEDEIN